jgi:hypothetical protein
MKDKKHNIQWVVYVEAKKMRELYSWWKFMFGKSIWDKYQVKLETISQEGFNHVEPCDS